MTAGTLTAVLPLVTIDPVDHLLVDLATGRHLPGDTIHVEQLAHDHGFDAAQARAALLGLWDLGFLSRADSETSGVVVWTPEASQVQLHRLARLMVNVVLNPCRTGDGVGVIDGEGLRAGAVEVFGLTVPSDVELFLEVAHALLAQSSPQALDDLATPIAVLFSDAALRVHGLELAADACVRRALVCEMVSSLIDGRRHDFADLVADYVLALGVA